MIIWLLLLFAAVIFYDCLTLLKTVKKREKVFYFVLMGIGVVLLTLYSLQIFIPSPQNAIIKVLDTLFHING